MRILPRVLLVPFPVGAYGHQIADSEQLLWNIKVRKKISNIYFFGIFLSKPANNFHAKLIRTEIFILPKFPFLYFHRLLRRISKTYHAVDFQIQKRGIELYSQLLSGPPSSLALATSFHSEIDELIRYFGCIPKFALLVCRDNRYDSLNGASIANERAFRNSDLEVFQKSITLLNKEGYTVVRLGRHNKLRNDPLDGSVEIQDIPSANPDKLDFCIANLCEFIISTGSGPDALGMFFRKPIYFINAPTVGFHQSRTIQMWLLKKVFSTCKNHNSLRPLNFDEAKKYLFDEQLLRDSILRGEIAVKSRSDDEILEAVEMCLKHFRGELVEPLEFVKY